MLVVGWVRSSRLGWSVVVGGWLSGSRLAKTVWMAVVGSRGGKTDWRVVVGWFVGWVTSQSKARHTTQRFPGWLVGSSLPGRPLIIASGICSVRQMMMNRGFLATTSHIVSHRNHHGCP
jgi:hypothetical protein